MTELVGLTTTLRRDEGDHESLVAKTRGALDDRGLSFPKRMPDIRGDERD